MTQAVTNDNAPLLVEDRSIASDQAGGLAAWREDLRHLTKPRIMKMVLVTAAIGFVMARRGSGDMAGASIAQVVMSQWGILTMTLIGLALACAGSSTLNQYLERDVDARMQRTRDRPLPAGRRSPRTVLALGVGLSVLGVAWLALWVNPLTGVLTAFTVVSYVLAYTPLKRVTSTSTIVGALPGALPPVMGASAATGRLGVEAMLLFAILFLWQLPHFLAIAWMYREDYARAGMPMLPVLDPTGASTFRQMALCCLALIPLGLTPTVLGVSGTIHFFVALAAGLGFLATAVMLVVQPSHARARLVFFASLIYLPLVYASMLLDQVA